MSKPVDTPEFYAKNEAEWRKWLLENSDLQVSIKLILYNKSSGIPSVDYEQAVSQALCFGYVDSRANKRDAESSYRMFSLRKARSNWSESNKKRVERLIKAGLMMPSGQRVIEQAKVSGCWDTLTEAQLHVIPADLKALFDENRLAFENFNNFSASSKRLILEWISTAKKAETRQKRMISTVTLASRNIKANH
jgi:uncharacterized protein YdeI (YjbR/CyaY-like superfamily)